MRLNISPSVWQSYINAILECLQSRKYCEAIVIYYCLLPTKESHMAKLEDLLKVLLKNGLKISPKKYQVFRKELQYMGKTIFIKDRRVCVKPLWIRLEAIQKLKPPTTVKGCKSYVAMVTFLTELFKPVYDLTEKGRQFIWEEEQKFTN